MSVLTDANFVIHGEKFVKVISKILLNHLHIIDKFRTFFEDEYIDKSIFNHTLVYLFKTYSRMRGKDVVRKIMARAKHNMKLHTRQKIAALSDTSTYAKKISNEEIDEHNELIAILEKYEHDDESEIYVYIISPFYTLCEITVNYTNQTINWL